MRLTFRQSIGSFLFKRYQHERHGVVETLSKQSVVYVRPCFGLKPEEQQQQPEVAEFRTQKPKKPKRARRLGHMISKLRAARSAGGDA
jgi:hypothetical protein